MANAHLTSVANKLTEYCKTGQEMKGLDELYDPDAASVEAGPGPDGSPALISGVEGIKGKHAWWSENFEVHSSSADGPFLHGDDQFAVLFEVDATQKGNGQRMQMKEVAIYTLGDNGKIVKEQFFNRPS